MPCGCLGCIALPASRHSSACQHHQHAYATCAACRRYQLPSSFGLPPGIDDFLVHFFCFYCASHQVGLLSGGRAAGTAARLIAKCCNLAADMERKGPAPACG